MPTRRHARELGPRLDFEMPDDEREDEDTIGGHVTARLGRLPRDGDVVRVGPYRATVLEVARRRIQWLRLEPAKADDTDQTDETEAP